ncbi:hypothetical protein HGA64_00915 [Candidatus Falkowbacteria bacterium]|nr:hypothetical protein [Candidatus Falkowbacteria bacterium]
MDILQQKIELQELINDLVSLGEDKEELDFWSDFFETLDDEERQKLFSNLRKEKEDLEKLKK